jgi:hypothetical protein
MKVNSSKLLSATCYFSVFFATFLFPVIVYFVTKEEKVKKHAKKSLFSHLLPFFILVLSIGGFIIAAATNHDGLAALPFLGIVVGGMIHLLVIIWNVIKGIQVLQEA